MLYIGHLASCRASQSSNHSDEDASIVSASRIERNPAPVGGVGVLYLPPGPMCFKSTTDNMTTPMITPEGGGSTASHDSNPKEEESPPLGAKHVKKEATKKK